MKLTPTPDMIRIVRVYAQGEIQLRESVLARATELPRDLLRTVLDVMVRDGLLTVRCVNGDGGSWENLYTLTRNGRDVVAQSKRLRKSDISYRI
jgi:hypothetical protein